MSNDQLRAFGFEPDELSDWEREIITKDPDAVTAMLAGSLRSRTPRLRPSDRRLVERFLAARDKARTKKVARPDAAKVKRGFDRGAARARARSDERKTADEAFRRLQTFGGDDAA